MLNLLINHSSSNAVKYLILSDSLVKDLVEPDHVGIKITLIYI